MNVADQQNKQFSRWIYDSHCDRTKPYELLVPIVEKSIPNETRGCLAPENEKISEIRKVFYHISAIVRFITRTRPFKAYNSTPPQVSAGRKLSLSSVMTISLLVFALYCFCAVGMRLLSIETSTWRHRMVAFGSIIWNRACTTNVNETSEYFDESFVTSPSLRRASSNTLRTWSSRTFNTCFPIQTKIYSIFFFALHKNPKVRYCW